MFSSILTSIFAFSNLLNNSALSCPSNYFDFQKIASYLNTTISTENNSYKINKANYVKDLYDLDGINRYLEVSYKNGYLIYDKIEDDIVESDFLHQSPYFNLKDTINIYSQNSFCPIYLYYKNNAIFPITNSNSSNFEAGEYYTNIVPSNSAVFIPNAFFFENLKNGHGNNFNGICSIISSEIILNYNDSFNNDTLIDDGFEQPAQVNNANSNNLYDFVKSPSTGTNNYYDETGQRFVNHLLNICENTLGFTPANRGMYTTEQIDFIKAYLDKQNVKYSLNTCEGNLADRITNRTVQFIKDTINSGRPVISNGTGHSTVAYGYDENFVYVHTGWGYVAATPWSTYETSMVDFEYDVGAIDIEIIDHVHSDNYFSVFNNHYICSCGSFIKCECIEPSEWGFEPQYFFYKKQNSHQFNELIVNTSRLRSGFIENAVVNLSPRREDAGSSYLKVQIDNVLTKFELEMAWWSENEFQNDAISLLYYRDILNIDLWMPFINIKEDLNLNMGYDCLQNYIFVLREETDGFMILNKNLPVGDRNKGRISIGKTKIYYLISN